MQTQQEELFRERLTTRRRVLARQLAEDASDLDVIDPEEDERASQRVHASLERALTDYERREIARITAALARLDAGTYGTCLRCGATIDPARLAIFPEAERCAPCTFYP